MRNAQSERSSSERGASPTPIEDRFAEAGVETWVPRFFKEIIHRRSKRLIVREFLLMPGYIFFDAPDRIALAAAFGVDGVLSVLGDHDSPVPIATATIELMRQREADLAFDDTREARLKRGEQGRTPRRTIAMKNPVGSRVILGSNSALPGMSGMVRSITGRRTLMVLMDELGLMVEVPAHMLAKRVQS